MRESRLRRFVATTLLIVALSSPTTAGTIVPSAANSSVDPCLVICPAGDIPFHVTVRDQTGVPIRGATVVLDFCPATSVHPCPGTECSVEGLNDDAGHRSLST